MNCVRLTCLFLLLAMFCAPTNAMATVELDEHEIEFLDLINAYRRAHGASCLSPSPTMSAAAHYMSSTMGEKAFFDHNEPPCDSTGDICTGRDPFERIADFGHGGWTSASENIAAGEMTAYATFEQWRNSPGHNTNMLDLGMTAIGIARVIVADSPYRVYWTTNFSNYVDGNCDCEGVCTDNPVEDEFANNVAGLSHSEVDNGALGPIESGGCATMVPSDASYWVLLGFVWWYRRRRLVTFRLM